MTALSRKPRRFTRFALRSVMVAGLLVAGAAACGLGYGAWVVMASRPLLTGTVTLSGLSAPAQIARDAAGVPVITASNRLDLARALGFVHGQERFFEMDLLRRAGAGELAELVGKAALPIDRQRRLHRFRARAAQTLAAEAPDQRALVEAYVAGVNEGLRALGHAPWEYTLMRVAPRPWTAVDTALVTYAIYFDLQSSDAEEQLTNGVVRGMLGDDWADFLNPRGTPHDAPVDGSVLPEPPMPAALPSATGLGTAMPVPPEPGSNNFAVAGSLTSTGAAIVADDMHLALQVPIIWYRARLVQGREGADATLDLVGVTLPGTPFLIVGSNRHVAWAFTNGYIDTGDAVLIDKLPGDGWQYQTPDGPRTIQAFPEQICIARAPCETLYVDETIWGPIVAHDLSGKPIAWAWTAHDPAAVRTAGFIGLENARTVRQALAAAHQAGMPQQNLLVGDSAGHIGWTIIGQVPRRVGLDDPVPYSWADGTHGWQGYLTPAEIPEIIDPPDGRLWSANARVVGGDGLAKLGDGGYDEGLRAGRIRDDLAARQHFAEPDLMAIQTDTRAAGLDEWQKLLLHAIAAHEGTSKIAALRASVENWGGNAVPDSVGYRLVHEFRAKSIRVIYGALLAPVSARLNMKPQIPSRAAWPVERLLTAQPPALVPAPFKSWDDVTGSILAGITANIDATPGGLAAYRWGAVNHTGIHHPLARALPAIGWLTDPPDVPLAGDTVVPRVAIPGFGASERLVVSPGHEESAIFNMPVGQAGNPLAPYYGAGEAAWVAGTPTPLLPGPARWVLTLAP